MTRPADVLPRVITQGGERVYAPWCDDCDSDDDTKWIAIDRTYSQAWCRHCDDAFSVTSLEAFRAREPSRLEARLAELRAEQAAGLARGAA